MPKLIRTSAIHNNVLQTLFFNTNKRLLADAGADGVIPLRNSSASFVEVLLEVYSLDC